MNSNHRIYLFARAACSENFPLAAAFRHASLFLLSSLFTLLTRVDRDRRRRLIGERYRSPRVSASAARAEDFKHCWQGNCTYICTGLRRTRLSVAARSRSVASRACVDRPFIPTSARRRSRSFQHPPPLLPPPSPRARERSSLLRALPAARAGLSRFHREAARAISFSRLPSWRLLLERPAPRGWATHIHTHIPRKLAILFRTSLRTRWGRLCLPTVLETFRFNLSGRKFFCQMNVVCYTCHRSAGITPMSHDVLQTRIGLRLRIVDRQPRIWLAEFRFASCNPDPIRVRNT